MTRESHRRPNLKNPHLLAKGGLGTHDSHKRHLERNSSSSEREITAALRTFGESRVHPHKIVFCYRRGARSLPPGKSQKGHEKGGAWRRVEEAVAVAKRCPGKRLCMGLKKSRGHDLASEKEKVNMPRPAGLILSDQRCSRERGRYGVKKIVRKGRS